MSLVPFDDLVRAREIERFHFTSENGGLLDMTYGPMLEIPEPECFDTLRGQRNDAHQEEQDAYFNFFHSQATKGPGSAAITAGSQTFMNADPASQTQAVESLYSASGCWPSWAFHIHSVTFMSENTAVKEESSGEQA